MKTILILVSLVATVAFAGDKVGNGGGLWACSPNDQIQNAILVDFYEAEIEFELTLPSVNGSDPLLLAEEKRQRLIQILPEYALRWSEIWNEMKPRIRYINAELTIIDDGLYRARPLAALCRSGWQYVQFANYKHDGDILIRKDLWQSSSVDIREKVGLLWHEIVYRWTREEFQDQESSRARRIVGILFSDLPPEKMREQIRSVVNVDPPAPGQPTWVCLIRGFDNATYSEYAMTEVEARTSTHQSCREKDLAQGAHCASNTLVCDSFVGAKPAYICTAYNQLQNKTFSQKGRSAVEAEAKTMQSCVREGRGFHCQMQQCQAL